MTSHDFQPKLSKALGLFQFFCLHRFTNLEVSGKVVVTQRRRMDNKQCHDPRAERDWERKVGEGNGVK
jgi:hypothetical protein